MKTVAVTTSPDRAAAATIPFRVLGLETVSLPCIDIVPAQAETLSQARHAAARAELIVVTSRRTLTILWPDALPEVPFAAVGAATSRAIRDRGGEVLVTGTGGSADLAEALRTTAAGRKVIWPTAVGADCAPHEVVAGVAGEFSAPVIYGSVPVRPSDAKVDMITFASPSAVAGWLLGRRLDEAPIAVIGSTTRAAIRQEGFAVEVEASTPTFQSLAEGVAEYLGVAA